MDFLEAARQIAEEVAREAEVELLDVAARGHGSSSVLCLIADTIGGISAETCASMSRRFDMLWEAEHGEQRGFGLEITSPGPKRKLAEERDFRLVTGRTVEIAYKSAVVPTEPHLEPTGDAGDADADPDEPAAEEVVGKVLSCLDGVLTLEAAGGTVAVPVGSVVRAKLVFTVGGSPSGSRRSAKRKASRRSKRSR